MKDLKSTYMGLELKNPIIAGASALTSNMASIKRLEDKGVAAVVTKSLFEEEIELERFQFEEDMEKNDYRHAEMVSVHPHVRFAGPEEHLMWVREAVQAVDIPVIGSLNCVHQDTWVDYGKQMAETGVAGLECNLFASPKEKDHTGLEIEKEHIQMVKELKAAVSVPVSLKLSFFYSNPVQVVHDLDAAGADALVLFNRLLEPDLDIEGQKHTAPFNFSHDTDYRLPLRYAGLLEGSLKADLCCSTGIFAGEQIVKMILAGASSVQVVSAIFRHGFAHVATMLKEVEEWMERMGWNSLDDFRGKMSKRNSTDPWAYTRVHYARLLMNSADIVKNAPTL